MSNKNSFKKLSDYIMTFAFLYSSFVCFTEAAEKWHSQKTLSIIILICGTFSFLAVFRIQIARLIYWLKGRYKWKK